MGASPPSFCGNDSTDVRSSVCHASGLLLGHGVRELPSPVPRPPGGGCRIGSPGSNRFLARVRTGHGYPTAFR